MIITFLTFPSDSFLNCITIYQLSGNELREFGDLELLNFTEGYYGLTEKTKLIIQSVAHKAQLDEISFDYLIKTDDDTFVNIPLICANFANFNERGHFLSRRVAPYPPW